MYHDDKVHLLGGAFLTTWTVLSLEDKSWRELWPRLRTGRVGHEAVVIKNVFYVLGGQTVDEKYGTRSCEMFDPVMKYWSKMKPMIVPRHSFTSTVLNEDIFVTGGMNEDGALSRCEKYNTRLHCWTELPEMSTPRHGHAAVVLEGVVFVIGGDSNTTEWFDTESHSWIKSTNLPTELTGHCGCVVNFY